MQQRRRVKGVNRAAFRRQAHVSSREFGIGRTALPRRKDMRHRELRAAMTVFGGFLVPVGAKSVIRFDPHAAIMHFAEAELRRRLVGLHGLG
jgi:hypothetical protein